MTTTTTHFDQLETREPGAREASQFNLLPGLLAHAIAAAPAWAAHLSGHDPAAITSRAALSTLPVLRKSALQAAQSVAPPFGGFATTEAGRLGRAFMSPGPLFEPEGSGEDWWRAARALYAAGFRETDVVHNTFSYHLTPGGWILDAGARALGCLIIPAGTAPSEQQLAALKQFRPTAYVGVPDYLKILLDKAAEAGIDMSAVKRASVSGGPLFPSLRDEYKSRGIDVLQTYATADLGVIAYESAGADGAPLDGMIVDEGVIVEIVKPGSGEPVPDGDVGEVVVTSFNRDYPMIRLATGDLSAVLPGLSSCGRTSKRIKGWLGRADQATKIKGMFVRPEQINELARRFPELGRLRLIVTREGERDVMTLHAEHAAAGAPNEALSGRLNEALQNVTSLSGTVELVAPGSLANDGKIIDDRRG